MKLILSSLILIGALAAQSAARAQESLLRIICEGGNAGAEVSVNGQFKGECPLDIGVNAGTFTVRAVKKFDATQERVFEQEVRMGDGVVKRVEAVLSAPRLRVAAQAPQKVVKALDIRLKASSSELDAESTRKLDGLVAALSGVKLEIIIAIGHSDASDGASNGMPLSTQRADAIKTYLAQKGIPANRVYVEGKGSTQPAGTPEENRRVELEAIGTQAN